jgi:hypothetical protein
MKTSKKHTNEINRIKKKYGFKKKFDLLKEIYHLPTAIALMQHLPRPAQTKKELEAIRAATSTLKLVLFNTAAQTKTELNQIPYFLMDIVGYKDIRHLNKEWNVPLVENDLNILLQTCDYALLQVPKDHGGPQKRSVPKYVIFQLASIFEQGTGKKPKCGWKDETDQYVGEFYTFLSDIKPLLDDLKIKMVSDESIGRYNVDILKYYKQSLREYDEIRIFFNQNQEDPQTI